MASGTAQSSARTSSTTNFDINKEEQQIISQVGSVKRLSVAVLVDGKYTQQQDGTYAFDPGADFDDLLASNQRYATSAPRNFDGYAHAGIAVVTCMDSRLQPLEMLGLVLGEADEVGDRDGGGTGGDDIADAAARGQLGLGSGVLGDDDDLRFVGDHLGGVATLDREAGGGEQGLLAEVALAAGFFVEGDGGHVVLI